MKGKNWKPYLKGHWQLYAMIAAPLIVLAVFSYAPMYGIILAFKKYQVSLGIWKSPWAENHGLNNFIRFFNNYNFKECLRNTLILSLYSLIVTTPCSILLALALNYVGNARFKKTVQMITYCPYFISTIVFVGIINMMFDNRMGVLGSFLYNHFGINVLGSPEIFPSLYVWSGVWQGMGWSSIIYISALSGVDYEMHEAAIVDGATKLQRILHIDLPSIKPTIIMMLILQLGSLMNVGFEKVFLLQNTLNKQAASVISTYVYEVGLINSDYGYSTAIGLFNSIINMLLLVGANWFCKKFADESLF